MIKNVIRIICITVLCSLLISSLSSCGLEDINKLVTGTYSSDYTGPGGSEKEPEESYSGPLPDDAVTISEYSDFTAAVERTVRASGLKIAFNADTEINTDITLLKVLKNVDASADVVLYLLNGEKKEMKLEIGSKLLGLIKTTVDVYYKDGVCYFNYSGMKVRAPVDADKLTESYMKMELLNIDSSAVRDFSAANDGYYSDISFTTDSKELSSSSSDVLTSIAQSLGGERLTVNYSDALITARVDRVTGCLTYFRLSYALGASLGESDGSEKTFTLDFSFDFDFSKVGKLESIPSAPTDLDSYKEIDLDEDNLEEYFGV